MANLNKVLLIGNLTKDPELRYTPAGTPVATLRLAVNRRFKNKNQEMKEETCFISVVVWSKQAETCNQYLHKGSPLFVEGRLQSRSWEDASGQKRSVIEVLAERVQFLGRPEQRGPSETEPAAVTTEAPAADPSSETIWMDEDDNQN